MKRTYLISLMILIGFGLAGQQKYTCSDCKHDLKLTLETNYRLELTLRRSKKLADDQRLEANLIEFRKRKEIEQLQKDLSIEKRKRSRVENGVFLLGAGVIIYNIVKLAL